MRKSRTSIYGWIAIATLPVICLAVVFFKKGSQGEMLSITALPKQAALDSKQEEVISAFARSFAALIREGKADEAQAVFNNEMLLMRAVSGVSVNEMSFENFRQGALSGITGEDGGALGSILGGNFHFLRILDRDGEPQLLFRLASDSGFDYYRFRFDFGGKSEAPRLLDFYNYTSGEYASDSMRRAVLPLIVEMGGELTEGNELETRDQFLIDHMDEVQAITKHMEVGENYLALQKLQALPGPLQSQRFMRGLELQILGSTAEKEADYIAAMEKMEKDFPDDPSMMMVMLDFYILKQDSARVHDLLDEVEKEVGMDPYHEVLRGMLHLADGEYKKAQKSAWSAISADASSREAWFIVLQAGLKGKNHRTVASALATMHTNFGMELGESAFQSPTYAEFFASPEGKALKAILQDSDPATALEELGR